MHLPQTILYLLTILTLSHAIALPTSLESLSDTSKELFKRKGGGGGRGGGGGGGRSRGGSRSSGSSSGGSSPGRTSSTSNIGGQTSRGSGTIPSYGSGGRYYGGGATVPYNAGTRRSGLGAPILVGAGAGLGVYGALWLYGAYAYPYPYYWTYRNNTSGQNETHPAQCWCSRYGTCSCEENNGTEYMNSVANNASIARVVNVNDTDTLVVNGTVDNGTTAAGGSDSAAGTLKMSEMMGYWPVVAGVAYTMWFM